MAIHRDSSLSFPWWNRKQATTFLSWTRWFFALLSLLYGESSPMARRTPCTFLVFPVSPRSFSSTGILDTCCLNPSPCVCQVLDCKQSQIKKKATAKETAIRTQKYSRISPINRKGFGGTCAGFHVRLSKPMCTEFVYIRDPLVRTGCWDMAPTV